MKVRIVCYEDVNAWILGKFALKLQEHLNLLNIDCDIDKVPDLNADINHHIIYLNYNGQSSTTDTVMITHVDSLSKINFLEKVMENISLGICMSKETMNNLSNFNIDRSKLCYINPAHDGVIIFRPKIIGLTCRVQEDGRKRELFLGKLAKDLSPNFFSFKIMGDGWDEQVRELKNNGFKVEYHNQFDYKEYTKLIPSLDYYLYMGQDEGQMGFVDALAAGVETIVTPQGYHLDAPSGITYPFNTYEELLDIFNKLTQKRLQLINSVATWNWMDYTKKHLEVWKYLISLKRGENYDLDRLSYEDGINSVYKFANRNADQLTYFRKLKIKRKLLLNNFYHHYNVNRRKFKDVLTKEGFGVLFKKIVYKLFCYK